MADGSTFQRAQPLPPHLADALVKVEAAFTPKVQRTRAEQLRAFAETQTKMGMARLQAVRARRRWLAGVAAAGNTGVSRFYPLPTPAEMVVILGFVADCRKRAAKARAEARALEAAAPKRRALRAA